MKTNIENRFAYANSKAGRFLILLAFALGLWLTHLPEWKVCFIAVVLMTYFHEYSRFILCAAGIYLWLFSDHLEWSTIPVIASNLQLPLFANDLIFRTSILLVVILFCLVYIRLVIRSGFLQRFPLGILLLLYLLLFVCVLKFPLTELAKIWAWGLLLITGKFFWFLAYAIQEAKRKKRRLKVIDALSFFPFWSNQDVPIPNGTRVLTTSQGQSEAELTFIQIKGLKLLCWSLILRGLDQILEAITFGRHSYIARILEVPSLYLPDPDVHGMAALTNGHVSALTCWLVIFAKSAIYLLTFAFYYGFFVAIARMAGFNILRNMYKPLAAHTFPSFWRRTMYYYSQLVTTLFILPYQNKLKGIKSETARFFFACWMGIFSAAISYHFVRDAIYFGKLHVVYAAYAFFSQIPFYFSVAFIVSCFLTIGRRHNFWNLVPAAALIRPAAHFVLAGILWSLIFDFRYNGGSWSTYQKFLLALIGINSV